MLKEFVNYKKYKLEYNILITVLLFSFVFSIIYYVKFYSNEEVFITDLDCEVQEHNSFINYELNTCKLKDNYDTYESTYPTIIKNNKFNKIYQNRLKKYEEEQDLITGADIILKKRSALDTYIYENDKYNVVSFLIFEVEQSYYNNDVYRSFDIYNYTRSGELTNNQIIKLFDYDLLRLKSKYKNFLMDLYLNEYNYSYYSLEETVGYIDRTIEYANIATIENFFIEDNNLTFVFNAITSSLNDPHFYKITYDGVDFSYKRIK